MTAVVRATGIALRYYARLRSIAVLFGAISILGATTAAAQDTSSDRSFSWSGTINAGSKVYVTNINGTIQVERSSSGRVEVTAEKRWKKGDPSKVRIELKRAGDNVAVCALWDANSVCEDDGDISNQKSRTGIRGNSNDVSVHFVVRLPDGVQTRLVTVNGGITTDGITSEMRAKTVNGSITVRNHSGAVDASTVNGSISAAIGALSDAGDLEFDTVNGSISVSIPGTFGGQVELATVNGKVVSDVPISVSGKLSSRKLRGIIGSGRSKLEASTVNGSISLKSVTAK